MKIVGYQIFLRITRFVILVIRPDYEKFCLRSTPGKCVSRVAPNGLNSIAGSIGIKIQNSSRVEGGKTAERKCTHISRQSQLVLR